MQIHISIGGQVQGPFTIEQINQGLEEGRWSINSTIAWYKGCSGWMPLKDVPGVKVRVEKPVSPPVSEPEQEEPTETIAVDTSPQSPQAITNHPNQASIVCSILATVCSILATGFIIASAVCFTTALGPKSPPTPRIYTSYSNITSDMISGTDPHESLWYMGLFCGIAGVLLGIASLLLAFLSVWHLRSRKSPASAASPQAS
jgi:hypothetical protein